MSLETDEAVTPNPVPASVQTRIQAINSGRSLAWLLERSDEISSGSYLLEASAQLRHIFIHVKQWGLCNTSVLLTVSGTTHPPCLF